MTITLGIWIGFILFILAMLAIDLGLFNRRPHAVTMREAAIWSIVWIALALLFNVGIAWYGDQRIALQFLTGYLIEKALSVDNLFVFVLIFAYFRVPQELQHKVLFWGVVGALVMRGAMIGAGAWLVSRFDWIFYVFGAFLVITGVRMASMRDSDVDPSNNPMLRLLRRVMPISPRYHGSRFFIREEGKGGTLRLVATPLFVVLVIVETTDLVFAVDSIPAIFAITTNPFIVFTSNVFAILGLRSLYFLLAGIIDRFHYLKLGLSAILVFVGVKMLIADLWHVPIGLSLAVVAGLLTISVVASLLFPKKEPHLAAALHELEPERFPTGDLAPVVPATERRIEGDRR